MWKYKYKAKYKYKYKANTGVLRFAQDDES
jgi:hypothetical protein